MSGSDTAKNRNEYIEADLTRNHTENKSREANRPTGLESNSLKISAQAPGAVRCGRMRWICNAFTRYLRGTGASWQFITQLGTVHARTRSMNAIMGNE